MKDKKRSGEKTGSARRLAEKRIRGRALPKAFAKPKHAVRIIGRRPANRPAGLKPRIADTRPIRTKNLPKADIIEENSKGSEARLNRSQAMAHLGSWELDVINNRLSWSDEVYRIFGLQPQEFAATYEAFLDAVHPDDRATVDAAYTGSLRDGRDYYEIEHRIVRKSTGEVRYVHEKCEHIRDAAGRIVLSVGMVHDVTEQKAAEEQIRNLARFPGENPNPILRVSPEGVILYANESCRSLGGERLCETGRLIPPEWIAIIEKAFTGRTKLEADLPAGPKVFSVSVVPFPESEYANLYARDVTERVRLLELVEEQRRLAQQSAAEAQQRADELTATFASMSEAVVVYDSGGRIQRANSASMKILGFDPGRLSTVEIAARLSTSHPDGRALDPAESPTARALAGRTVTNERYLLTNAGGRKITVEVSAAPLRNGDVIVGAVTVMHDITEREQWLDTMRRRAVELDAVINSIADGVMIHDTAATIVRLNPAAEKITGYSREDIGLPLAERTTKVIQVESADGRRITDSNNLPVPRALRGETVRGEVMGIHHARTGELRWVSVSAAPLCTPDGIFFGAVSTLMDITARMKTENELVRIRGELESRVRERTLEVEEANSYNRSLIDATLDPLVTITAEGKIGDVNPATEAITGCTRKELIGTDFSNYFTDEVKARAGYRRVFSEGKVSDYELEIRHRDGRITPVLYNASVYTDETLKVKGVIAAARDITRRRQAEARLWENTRRIEATAEISHLLAEAGPNYQAVTDQIAERIAQLLGEECLIHLLSPAGRLDLAYDHRAAGGDSGLSAAGSSEMLEGFIDRVFQAKQPLFLPVVSAETIRRAGGPEGISSIARTGLSGLLIEPLIFQDSALGTLTVARFTPNIPYTVEDLTLLRNIADRLALAIANSHLYSDLKNALAEEQKTRQQLIQTEKLAAMGRLLGSVAHELNNPLQTIKNCLYLVQQEAPKDVSIQEYIGMASSETQRLVHLVAELRELYRAPSEKALEAYDLAEILREVRKLLDSQLQSGNVRWQESEAPQGCIVRCEKERIQQVFINLAANAIEAMQPGGGTLSVNLILSEDSRRVGAVFTDTGPGIPPELIKNLFEPFVTTKPTGLGLGLPICYEIAQKHGGQITVDSQPGRGATFTLWLPRWLRAWEKTPVGGPIRP